ncbi:MAG: helix-hairpin-helix domain-containing protein [Gammaproteobacteria bacterium]|nr:helix-hairpin-helix domain-containing protein [Gammaproteobacteria bacterium]
MSLALTDVSGVGLSTAEILIANNVDSVKKLAKIDIEELTLFPGIGKISGLNMIQAAKDLLGANKPDNKAKNKRRKSKKDKKGKNKKGKDKKGKNKKGKQKKK